MRGAIPPLPHTSSRRGAQLINGYDFMALFLVQHSPTNLHTPSKTVNNNDKNKIILI
jgi:hypothetical protein